MDFCLTLVFFGLTFVVLTWLVSRPDETPEKSSNESGAFRSKEENPDVSPLVAVVVVNVAESGNHGWSEGAERTQQMVREVLRRQQMAAYRVGLIEQPVIGISTQ